MKLMQDRVAVMAEQVDVEVEKIQGLTQVFRFGRVAIMSGRLRLSPSKNREQIPLNKPSMLKLPPHPPPKVNIKQAAEEITTYTVDWLQQLCRDKRIKAETVSGIWIIETSSLIEYAQKHGKLRRNPKS
jgi:hypothetical protein